MKLLPTVALAALGLCSACNAPSPDGPRLVTRDGAPVTTVAPRPLLTANGKPVDQLVPASYQEAKDHLLAERYGLAVQVFRRALAENPTSVPAMNGLAIAYGQIGRDDLSLRWFERALAADPSSVETLNNVGYWALERGQFELARRYLLRADALSPGQPQVTANLALLNQLDPVTSSLAPSSPPLPATSPDLGPRPLFRAALEPGPAVAPPAGSARAEVAPVPAARPTRQPTAVAFLPAPRPRASPARTSPQPTADARAPVLLAQGRP